VSLIELGLLPTTVPGTSTGSRPRYHLPYMALSELYQVPGKAVREPLASAVHRAVEHAARNLVLSSSDTIAKPLSYIS